MNGAGFNTALVPLAAGDASKTLVAAVTGMRIKVFRLAYLPNVSAAQLISVATGATVFHIIASGTAVNAFIDTGWMNGGVVGVVSTALIATPAAAGPAGTFVVVYTIE